MKKSRLKELMDEYYMGKDLMEKLYGKFPLEIAEKCGPPEIEEILERLDNLYLKKEKVEDWDGDSRDDIYKSQKNYSELLSKLTDKFSKEVVKGLKSKYPDTRYWTAYAFSLSPKPEVIPELEAFYKTLMPEHHRKVAFEALKPFSNKDYKGSIMSKSYYLLKFEVDSHYEDYMTAISLKKEDLISVLRKKLSGQISDFLTQEFDISVSRIEKDEGDEYESFDEVSLYPYIEVLIKGIDYKYWHWDEETDEEYEYTFPKEMLITFPEDTNMTLWAPDRTPLKITCLENPDNEPLIVPENDDLMIIMDMFWEKAIDEESFDNWSIELVIKDDALNLLSELEGPALEEGESGSFGTIGVDDNGELNTITEYCS